MFSVWTAAIAIPEVGAMPPMHSAMLHRMSRFYIQKIFPAYSLASLHSVLQIPYLCQMFSKGALTVFLFLCWHVIE